ncbi:SDR family oxidoreductase [bacterium]|nr:SDR family oxidoreductase [bacterium]
MHISKKTIVITGASSGIGLATGLNFANQNWNVVNLDLAPPKDALPKNIHWYKCNVCKWEDIQTSTLQIKEKFSSIDALFVNAGSHTSGILEETSNESFEKILNLNIRGAFYILKSILPLMKKQKNGSIVLCGSEQVFQAAPESAVYAMSKAAVVNMAKTSALDAGPYGVRVNAICPGPTHAPMLDQAIESYTQAHPDVSRDKRKSDLAKKIPLGRIAHAEEIADVVSYLCSEQASYLSGAIIPLTGGR